jgi:hypothetical protein
MPWRVPGDARRLRWLPRRHKRSTAAPAIAILVVLIGIARLTGATDAVSPSATVTIGT